MRSVWKDVLTALVLGFILPGIIANTAVKCRPMEPLPAIRSPVPVRTGEEIREMELEDYIAGVVLAEMPAVFEEEALKAQAVAARTYTRKAMLGGKHGDGSVCTDSTCCQGYISREDYLLQGGKEADADRVRSACASTEGLVLVYEGELIDATYFSSSGGETESALEVWGGDVPYLQSVPSPEGEEDVHSETLRFSPEEFSRLLGRTLAGSPETWFTLTTYTEGGGVASMTVGGQVYSGTELRSLLGLRSTAFTVAADRNGITVTTRGYGHRVGMSQYGANAMALSGSGYARILSHYYPGTELRRLEIDEKGKPE